MSVRVKIPTQLRQLTDGSDEVTVDGRTIAEIIEQLEAAHPGMRSRLLDDGGGLRRFVNVYLEDEDIRFLDGIGTTVPDGAKLSIIPAVAGG